METFHCSMFAWSNSNVNAVSGTWGKKKAWIIEYSKQNNWNKVETSEKMNKRWSLLSNCIKCGLRHPQILGLSLHIPLQYFQVQHLWSILSLLAHIQTQSSELSLLKSCPFSEEVFNSNAFFSSQRWLSIFFESNIYDSPSKHHFCILQAANIACFK